MHIFKDALIQKFKLGQYKLFCPLMSVCLLSHKKIKKIGMFINM